MSLCFKKRLELEKQDMLQEKAQQNQCAEEELGSI